MLRESGETVSLTAKPWEVEGLLYYNGTRKMKNTFPRHLKLRAFVRRVK